MTNILQLFRKSKLLIDYRKCNGDVRILPNAGRLSILGRILAIYLVQPGKGVEKRCNILYKLLVLM